jgi:hypothetical protein
MRELSQVQIHFGAQTDCGKVYELWQRVSGGEIPEGWTGDRLPEQRMRLRAAGAGVGGGDERVETIGNWGDPKLLNYQIAPITQLSNYSIPER